MREESPATARAAPNDMHFKSYTKIKNHRPMFQSRDSTIQGTNCKSRQNRAHHIDTDRRRRFLSVSLLLRLSVESSKAPCGRCLWLSSKSFVCLT